MATVATINECLAELKSLAETALVSTYANIVRDYRTFPDKLPAEVVFSYQGEQPTQSTLGGQYGAYDVTAVLAVQVDVASSDPEDALRDAEQALNTLENQLTALLDKGGAAYRTDYWLRTLRDQPTSHPPSPIEAPNLRWANVPFRLILGAMPD